MPLLNCLLQMVSSTWLFFLGLLLLQICLVRLVVAVEYICDYEIFVLCG